MKYVIQLCFRAITGVDGLMLERPSLDDLLVRPRRKGVRRGPRVSDGQLRFWRPPIERPHSHFARKALSRAEQAFGKLIVDDPPWSMPANDQECAGVTRTQSCPFVRCRHHLAVEVNEIGSLKINFPGWEIDDLGETCSLRAARRGPQTVEWVAEHLNLSAERVRQIEREAWRQIRRLIDPDRLWRGRRPAGQVPLPGGPPEPPAATR